MSVQTVSDSVRAASTEPGITWRSKAWLAPRLVAVALAAIVLSLAGEYVGASADVLLLLNMISYFAGGYYGSKSAIEGLRQGEIDVDLLMVLAALGAAALGEWHEGAVLLFLFSFSNVLQDYAIGRSRGAIQSLFKLYPEVATVKRGDAIFEVAIDQIHVGDTVLIEPGERIPVDGLVIAGCSAVDESPITGESLPVDKAAGARVFAGTLNKQGSLDVRSLRSAKQTTLARIIELVEEAQNSKALTQLRLDRFEQRYAKLIIFSIALIILVPPLLGTADFQSNFYRAMVLMTVASPCALVISVPSAVISAIAAAARSGVLFKGGASLERLAEIKVIAVDKTGTLTVGRPRVTDIAVTEDMTAEELMRTAASIEARSEHPLAKAIVSHAAAMGIALGEITEFIALPGRGVRARLGDEDIRVGRLAGVPGEADVPESLIQAQNRFEAEGKTTVAVLRNETWLGLIALADEIRTEAPSMVSALRRRGMKVAMLTGDNSRAANAIASQLGIQQVHAELLPEDKAIFLSQMRRDYGPVAMVGDGINDAPALAAADVGIAMGDAGADVALEAADLAIMGDNLGHLITAIDLSRRAGRVVQQNIVISLAVIALLLTGVFVVDLPLPIGVLGHEGSTVLVVLNGLLSLLVLPELRRRFAQR